jgi:hypothetical protein
VGFRCYFLRDYCLQHFYFLAAAFVTNCPVIPCSLLFQNSFISACANSCSAGLLVWRAGCCVVPKRNVTLQLDATLCCTTTQVQAEKGFNFILDPNFNALFFQKHF